MEVIRSIFSDPIEVVIPLVDDGNGEFVTTDVLHVDDIHVYYWDISAAGYVEATFSGTVETVKTAPAFLHRVSINMSTFQTPIDIDTTKPISVAVVDDTATKVYKDTGFLIWLKQDMNLLITNAPFVDPKGVADSQMLVNVKVVNDNGIEVDPFDSDISIKAFRGSVLSNSSDFYDDIGLTVAATASGVGSGVKFKKQGTGKYYTYFKIPLAWADDTVEYTITCKPLSATQPLRTFSAQAILPSLPTETQVTTIDGKVDIIDTNVDTSLVNQASMEGKIDTVDTNVDTSLVNQTNIEGKIDTVDANVDTSLVNQATIDGKIDIIDTNVDTGLVNQTSIEGKIDTSLVNETNIEGKIDTGLTNQGVIDGKIDIIDSNVDDLTSNLAIQGDTIDNTNNNVIAMQGDVTLILADTGTIVAKLPTGQISDLALSTLVDGIPLGTIQELLMAMMDGRILKDDPEVGDLTFYKRDNSTILTITRSTETERTRV